VLARVGERWQQVVTARGRRLEVRTDPAPVGGDDIGPVVSIPAVDHILDILVDNAVVHGTGTIALRAAPAARGGVRLVVDDEGPGIEGDPDAVFDRRSPGATGHGIGLALARSLAEAEGGRLRVRATSPAGTSMELLLPGRPGAGPAAPARTGSGG
jgi:signal transduction histidine kinase